MLLIAFAKTREEDLAKVGLAVAVSVLGIEDIGGSAYKDAFSPCHDAAWEVESGKEHGRMIVSTIIVTILEKANDTTWRPLAVDPRGIVPHLGHPEFAVSSPVEGNGIKDLWFARDQLYLEAVACLEALSAFLRLLGSGTTEIQQLLERAAIHHVGEICGVFVLHPKMPAMEPRPIVRIEPPARNHRDGVGVVALSFPYCVAPARMPTKTGIEVCGPKVNAPVLLIGKHDVIKAVIIKVHKPQAFARVINTIGQTISPYVPAFLFCVPTVNTFTDQFANAVIVNISKDAYVVVWFADLGRELLQILDDVLFGIDCKPAAGASAQGAHGKTYGSLLLNCTFLQDEKEVAAGIEVRDPRRMINHFDRVVLRLPTGKFSRQIKTQRILAIHRQHETSGAGLAFETKTTG